jgi:hypothetical protein
MSFPIRGQSRDWLKPYLLTLIISCILIFLAALIVYAYTGTSSRYTADDYSFANMAHSHGLFGAVQTWFQTWNGTFSASFIISLMALIGPKIVTVLPLLALALWLICLTWTIMQFTQKFRLAKPLFVSIFLALLLIATVLNTIPSIFESFYWQTGMLVYLLPLIIGTVYIGLIGYSIRKNSKSMLIPLSILSLIFTFIACGCSQTYGALQTGTLFLVMLIGLLQPTGDFKRRAMPLIVAGFIGSLLALIIIIIAPGNAARESFYPPHPDLFTLIKSSISNTFYYMGYYYNFHHALDIGIVMVLSGIMAFTMHPLNLNQTNEISPFNPTQTNKMHASKPNPKKMHASKPKQVEKTNQRSFRAIKFSLVLSPIIGFILLVFCFAPTIWGESVTHPPLRAIIIPQFILVCTAIYWSYYAGLALRYLSFPIKKTAASVLLVFVGVVTIVLLIFGPIMSIQRNISSIPAYRDYAAALDSRDAELRAAKSRGEKDVALKPEDTTKVPLVREFVMESDPNYWVNKAVAEYYGLNSIKIVVSP